MIVTTSFLVAVILSITKASEIPLTLRENDYLKISHTELYSYQEFVNTYFTIPHGDGKKRSEKNLLVGFVKPNSQCFERYFNIYIFFHYINVIAKNLLS